MTQLVEHVVNIFVVDRNGRPISGASVVVRDADGVELAGARTEGTTGANVSLSLDPAYTTIQIVAEAQGKKHAPVTVDTQQRRLVITFADIELPGAPMTAEAKAAYVFGVAGVITMLAITFAVPDPTDFQYTVYRIVLAIAVAGVAGVIPGLLNVQVGNFVKAAGALAVFVVVYFYSPVAWVVNQRAGQ